MRFLTKKFLLFLLGTILMVTTCDFSSISFAAQENNAILGEVIMEPQNLQIEPDLIEHSNFQNNAMPTPVPLFKYCDDSDIDSYKLRVDSSASVQPSFTPVSSGYTSLTFESIFPTSGDYWNHLAYWDPHAGQWFDVPGQGYYATNGNHTIGGLQEGTTYRLFMSWWDYSIGGWKDLSLDMSTDYNWSTPSITATNITSTSITINVIYPKSGQYGNGLFKSDPYDFLVPGWNVTNGNYTLSELQPNTTYFFDMVWYTDGDNSWLRRKLTITVTTLPVSYPDQNIQFSNIQGPEGALPGIKDSSSILSGKNINGTVMVKLNDLVTYLGCSLSIDATGNMWTLSRNGMNTLFINNSTSYSSTITYQIRVPDDDSNTSNDIYNSYTHTFNGISIQPAQIINGERYVDFDCAVLQLGALITGYNTQTNTAIAFDWAVHGSSPTYDGNTFIVGGSWLTDWPDKSSQMLTMHFKLSDFWDISHLTSTPVESKYQRQLKMSVAQLQCAENVGYHYNNNVYNDMGMSTSSAFRSWGYNCQISNSVYSNHMRGKAWDASKDELYQPVYDEFATNGEPQLSGIIYTTTIPEPYGKSGGYKIEKMPQGTSTWLHLGTP